MEQVLKTTGIEKAELAKKIAELIKHDPEVRGAVMQMYWFSVKWRIGSPELHLSGRPSPSLGTLPGFQEPGAAAPGDLSL